MKRLNTIISWMVELAIVAVLLWKHYDLYYLGWYDFDGVFILLLASPIVLIIYGVKLIEKHLPKKVRLKLFLLTGPTVFLCMSLVMGLSYELRKVAVTGGVPIEVVAEVNKNKENPPNLKGHSYVLRVMSEKLTRSRVVYYLGVERAKSERIIYAMLLVITCILYGNRYSLGRLEYSEGPPNTSIEK